MVRPLQSGAVIALIYTTLRLYNRNMKLSRNRILSHPRRRRLGTALKSAH